MKNLILRSITGALYVAAVVGATLLGPQYFVVLFGLIAGLTLWEFAGLVNRCYGASTNRLILTVACSFPIC